MNLRRLLFAVLPLAGALLAGGWIFRTAPAAAPDAYAGAFAGGQRVSVRPVPGPAAVAAERAAADYRAAGWTELPVSTRTFRLFARGARTAALLAEDAPDGRTLLAEFRHEGNQEMVY